jgi:hypothetical protein
MFSLINVRENWTPGLLIRDDLVYVHVYFANGPPEKTVIFKDGEDSLANFAICCYNIKKVEGLNIFPFHSACSSFAA